MNCSQKCRPAGVLGVSREPGVLWLGVDGMVMGSEKGFPVGQGHWILFYVSRGLILGVSAGSQAGHMTRPLQDCFICHSNVGFTTASGCFRAWTKFECLGSNPPSTTF